MNLLSISQLSKSFTDKPLFTEVSFGIDKGQKMGLIAHNGAGKSTLFKILTGKEIQDGGEVVFREGTKIGMLDQEPVYPSGMSIREFIYADNPRIQLIKQYEELIADGDMESEKFLRISDEIEAHNAWGEEAKINEVLDNLLFTNLDVTIDSFSGGEKRRLALAKCLIEEPDILLLDEPTNHLDFGMVEWLERFLSDSSFALLLITHDRYFLDNVCETILELTPKGIYTYQGDYEFFLQTKADREMNDATNVHKAKNLFKKELEWLRRMPKARGTKSKSRIEAAGEIEKKAKQKLEKNEVNIGTAMQRLGKKILEVDKVSKSYGERVIIKDFSYYFKGGDKIGIVGENGSGKTTLLNLLTGLDPEFTGEISLGDTVSVGYYTQKGMKINTGNKVIDEVKNIAEVIELKDGSRITASQMLTQFNFPPDRQYALVDKLSGGERKRLYLVTILMKAPNFLILDEPTNDFDLLTLSVLEDYLMNFKGCVLIVSHDRYFLDRIVESLFVFNEGGYISNYPGNYTLYRAYKKEQDKLPKAPEKRDSEPEKKSVVKETQNKLSFNEKKEFENLENEIFEMEELKIKIQNNISTPNTSGDKINELSQELATLLSQLEIKNCRWLELAEKAG